MYPLYSNKRLFSSYTFVQSVPIHSVLCYALRTSDASFGATLNQHPTHRWIAVQKAGTPLGNRGLLVLFSITPLALYQWESLILKQLVVEHLPHAIR